MNSDNGNVVKISAAESKGKRAVIVSFELIKDAWCISEVEIEEGEKAFSVNVTKEEREILDRIFRPFLFDALEKRTAGHLVMVE